MRLPRTRRTRTIAAVVAVLAVAVVLGGARVRAGSQSTASRCAGFAAESAARAGIVTGRGPDVLVIGDSWAAGHLLEDPADSWPSRLPGRVHVAAFSGSGYGAGDSPCPHVSFADRAPAALRGLPPTAPVVVEGGLNDWDQTDTAILAGFEQLLAALHGHPVTVVAPAFAPSRAAFMTRVRTLLADASARDGIRFVTASGAPTTYLPDRLHPDRLGHAAFGDAVAAAIAATGGLSAAPAR